MKVLKWIVIVLGSYVLLVVAFEALIGFFQPSGGTTLVITTFDGSGAHDRVVARIESDGQLYVSANHWPRAWYRRAIEHPEVRIVMDGKETDRFAVPVTGEERDRVEREHSLGLVFRFLTGFPPRRILRLDPRP